MKGLTKNADRDTLHIGENESQNIILRRNGIMNKKLLIAAAIAFAVFAVPCGNNALATVSVASENNTVAPSIKPVEEVKKSITAIDATKITDYDSAENARNTLKNIGKADLQNAMNKDASTLSSIADIEDKYRVAKGVEATKIENQENVAVEAVGIVGGAFYGNSTKVELAAPAEKPAVTTADYVVSGDPVYVDINFKTEDHELHSFAIPIAVSVKVPAGIDGSKAVVFHFAASGQEAIKPVYNSADNTLTFAVKELSTFAIAEAKAVAKDEGTDNAFQRYRDNMVSEIANAKDGAIIKITRDKEINALPNDIMQALYKKQTVTLVMEYTYNDKEYTVTIPAGKAQDNSIEWYGPLYLQMYYGK